MKLIQRAIYEIKANYLGIAVFNLIGLWRLMAHYPDINWDRANYADYVVYSLFTNRWDKDWAVGGLNTYNNPIISIPGYLFSIGNGTLGFIFLFVFLSFLYIIVSKTADLIFNQQRIILDSFVKALAVNIALAGPLFFSEIGTTMGDWPLIILTALSFYFLLRLVTLNHERSSSILSVFFMVIATSLKITNAVFLIASIIVILIRTKDKREIFEALKNCVIGFLLALPIASIWFIRVFDLTGNPVFPYYNNIFRSDFFPPESVRDNRWKIENWYDYFIPMSGIWGPENLEFPAFDPRFSIALTIAFIILFRNIEKVQFIKSPTNEKRLLALKNSTLLSVTIFCVASYLIWAQMLFYARYAMPLEIPLGILLLLLITIAFKDKKSIRLTIIVVFISTLFALVPNWNLYQGDLKEASNSKEKYFGDPRWQITDYQLMNQKATYLVVGMHLGYLVRSAHVDSSFIRAEFYRRVVNIPPLHRTKLQEKAIFLLTNEDPGNPDNLQFQDAVLAKYGLVSTPQNCRSSTTISERYWICSTKRISD